MLTCPNCGAAISIQRFTPLPLSCQSCGVQIRAALTPVGVGLFASVGMLWIPFVLAIIGMLSTPVVMPALGVVLALILVSFWQWGWVVKRR
jgi:hypothetical protein